MCGKVVRGEPVINGARGTVHTVPTSLAEGAKITEILAGFPHDPGRGHSIHGHVRRRIQPWEGCFVIVTDWTTRVRRAGRLPHLKYSDPNISLYY